MVNVCVKPVPEAGDNDTTAGGPAEAGIHRPFFAQPLLDVAPFASRYTFFSPTKVPVKVSATFSVRLLPEVLKEEPLPANVHWLFDTDPEEPGITPVDNAVPALL